jgi:N-acetylmuramoyl-L-alanine amidase
MVSRWLLAAWLLAWSTIGTGANLKDLRFVTGADGLRAELLLDARVRHQVFTLDNPLRLVVDLDNTRAPRSPRMVINAGPVTGVRSAVHGNGLRVVMDLSKKVTPTAVLKSPSRKGRPYRLVVTLSTGAKAGRKPVAKAARVTSTVATAGRHTTRVRARVRPGTVSQVPVGPKAESPSKTVGKTGAKTRTVKKSSRKTKPAVAEPPPRLFIVAVDAGHGGKDPGAKGRRGTLEKTVVLAIARRLKKEIDKVPGMKAVLIRSGDRFVDLRGRINKARRYHADLFVSIHADAFKKSSASGASVFVLSRRGATSESARWLAKQENAPFLAGGVVLVDKNDDLRKVFLDMSQDASLEAGFGVAERVLKKMGRVTKLHKGEVERAGFLVLKSPDIPSILVETGFLSNPVEERKLRDPKHQARIARAIRDGLLDYFSRNPPTGTLLAEQKHTIKRGETLSGIAHRYSVSLSLLRSVNGIQGNMLRVGQTIRIPGARYDG